MPEISPQTVPGGQAVWRSGTDVAVWLFEMGHVIKLTGPSYRSRGLSKTCFFNFLSHRDWFFTPAAA
jgi:hypothetical protein